MSIFLPPIQKIDLPLQPLRRPDGGIGRRVGLKHQWGNTRAGSTPALGTKQISNALYLNQIQRILLEQFGELASLLPLYQVIILDYDVVASQPISEDFRQKLLSPLSIAKSIMHAVHRENNSAN